mmetsp:Transcript_4899/g.15549  ORF Transcript_4899/g.15549 Transcript_4899/m.15549 type:complete len:232 (+) Transcript_4899:431-1126(+)
MKFLVMTAEPKLSSGPSSTATPLLKVMRTEAWPRGPGWGASRSLRTSSYTSCCWTTLLRTDSRWPGRGPRAEMRSTPRGGVRGGMRGGSGGVAALPKLAPCVRVAARLRIVLLSMVAGRTGTKRRKDGAGCAKEGGSAGAKPYCGSWFIIIMPCCCCGSIMPGWPIMPCWPIMSWPPIMPGWPIMSRPPIIICCSSSSLRFRKASMLVRLARTRRSSGCERPLSLRRIWQA